MTTLDVRRRREQLWVALLLLLAVGFRLFGTIGVDDGEWVVAPCDDAAVRQIAPILASGDPLHFEVLYYPPVPAMITAAAVGIWRMIGGAGALPVQCRIVSLLVSVATVAVVYMLGGLWGPRHGLIAMAFYAVTMLAVVAQSNVAQVYSAFFLALALYWVLQAEASGTATRLALAGICLGLGVASKYTPAFFAGILFVPYVLRSGGSGPGQELRTPPTPDVPGRRALARLWSAGLWTLVGAALAALLIGIAGKEVMYDLLREIYDRRSHANRFEYHLPWIDRLYYAGLAAFGFAGAAAGAALLVPRLRNVSPWGWAASFYARHRLWILPWAALVFTVVVGVALPAALNVHDFARDFTYIAKTRGSGDNGMLPGFRPAVSYIAGYIPESIGIPLFVAGLVGVLYLLIRPDKRAILLVAGSIPTYVALELSRVKVNRYALELLSLWCLIAAIWLGDLLQVNRRVWRWAGRAAVVGTIVYSSVYSLAWAEFYSPRGRPQTEAGKWLSRTIPSGSSLGVQSGLLVSGSPELLPDAAFLAGYRLVDYTEHPEYVLLPVSVRAIIEQYLEGFRRGYVYTADDWQASSPTADDLDVLSRIVREEGYVLLKEFRKRPVVLGIEVTSNSLSGRTWMVERNSASGLRIYRRIADHR